MSSSRRKKLVNDVYEQIRKDLFPEDGQALHEMLTLLANIDGCEEVLSGYLPEEEDNE